MARPWRLSPDAERPGGRPDLLDLPLAPAMPAKLWKGLGRAGDFAGLRMPLAQPSEPSPARTPGKAGHAFGVAGDGDIGAIRLAAARLAFDLCTSAKTRSSAVK